MTLAASLSYSAENPKKFTPVQCSGQPTDRALIQSAIDNAHNGDTIKLIGICQLDGTRIFLSKSNLTITGAGAEGGWSTVVNGIVCTAALSVSTGCTVGLPATDFLQPTLARFNRGFSVGDDNTGNLNVQNVTISNIKFTTLHRAIQIDPSIGGDTAYCSDTTIGNGSASSITLEKNWFDNNNRAIQNFGTTNKLIISNNTATNGAGDVDFELQGIETDCADSTGQFIGIFGIGVPKNASIIGNTISKGQQETFDIGLTATENTKVAKNDLSGALGAMILIQQNKNAQVTNNSIDAGGAIGIYGSVFPSLPGAPTNSNIKIGKNTIQNGAPGVVVDSGSTGYSIIKNHFINSTVADIYLCGPTDSVFCVISGSTSPSFNNLVVAFPDTIVLDDGINNKVIRVRAPK